MVQNSLKQGLPRPPRHVWFLLMLLAHTLETACSPKLAYPCMMKPDGSSSSFTNSSAWLSSFPPMVPPHAQLDTAQCLLCSPFKPLCKSSGSLLCHVVTANNTAECCLRYRNASSSLPVRPTSVPPPPSVICRTLCLFLIVPLVFHQGPGSLPRAGSASVPVHPLLQAGLNQGGRLTHQPPPTPLLSNLSITSWACTHCCISLASEIKL